MSEWNRNIVQHGSMAGLEHIHYGTTVGPQTSLLWSKARHKYLSMEQNIFPHGTRAGPQTSAHDIKHLHM